MARNEGHVFPSSDAESLRLEGQARLYGGVDVLSPFLAQGPGAVLDVGCGSGHFTRQVAGRLPRAAVVGLELDESRIAFARSRCGAPNLRYEQGDLRALPFEDGQFDLVYCRFVLVHDQDPLAALREMARVTRPAGRVVAYDMVHEGIWFSPPRPAFERLMRTTVGILRERGGEPNQGLHLASGMIRAGLAEVQARVIAHHALATERLFEAYRDNWIATVSSLAQALGTRFDDGLVDAARQELEEQSDDQFLVEITVLAHGRKRG